MKKQNFTEMVNLIIKEDDRYTKEAYSFLKEALDFTMDKERKRKGKIVTKNQRHVSGQELLEGAREFALNQYGPMAYTKTTPRKTSVRSIVLRKRFRSLFSLKNAA
jgi:uncharacterized repeat protein (TIGR04138 family)